MLAAPCRASAEIRPNIEGVGDLLQVAIPVYALGMTMQESDWIGMRQFAYSFGAMQITTIGLKNIVHAPRPNGRGNDSFPSGHTAAAFSGAAFIHSRYGWRRAIIPYAAAAFTGYSRIQSKWHYAHDVLAGAAAGALWAFLFTEKIPPVQISASADGVSVSFRKEF